ncbi:hypothetical protein MMPV_005858 [Pyropia vietnamensis]
MSRAVRRLEERLAAEARAAADAAALSDGSSDSSSASGSGVGGRGSRSGPGGGGEGGGGGGGLAGGGGGGGALNPFDLLGGSGDGADASSDEDSDSDGKLVADDVAATAAPLPVVPPVAGSTSRGRRPEERSPTFQASVASTMREVEELVLSSAGLDAAPGGRRGGKGHAGAATAATGHPTKGIRASKEAAAARRRAEAAETAALAAAIEGAPAQKGVRTPKAGGGRGKRGEAAAPPPPPPPTTLADLMAVEAGSLSADGELKRLFGARAVAAERAAAAAADEAAGLPLPPGAGGGRRGRGGRRGAVLVPPRAAAASGATPGLSMEVIPDGERDGGQDVAAAGAPTPWRYVHTGAYAAAEAEFRAVVASGDPNGVVALLNTAPGHAGALLQLGEVYRGMGERERAAEAVERALGVLEGGFSPGYRPWGPTAPTVCLPWAAPSNRLLYRALLRYAQGLSARGLHATAWSVARVLWGLDRPTGADPVGVGLCLDSLALLGGGGGWVAAAVAAPDPVGAAAPEGVPLSHHPNWALSAALGVAIGRGVGGLGPPKRGRKAKRGAEPSAGGGGGGGVAAGGPVRLDMAVPAAAGDPMVAMADALLAFPMLLEPLLTVVEDRSGAASDLPLFAAVPELLGGLRDGGVLARIARIYAARSKLVWNAPAAVMLLRQAATDANRLWVAAGRGSGGHESTATVSAAGTVARRRVAAAETLRASAVERFVATRRYVGLVASDFVENAAALPPEALGVGGLGGGPDGGVAGGDGREGLPPGGLEALMNALAAGGGEGGVPAVDQALLAQRLGGGVPPGGGGGGVAAAAAAADVAGDNADRAAARRAVLRGLGAAIDGDGAYDDDSEMSATASGDEAAAAAAAEAAAAAAAASGGRVVAPPGAVRAGLAAAAARVAAWLASWSPGGLAATLAVWVDRLRVALLGGGEHAHAA